MEWKLRFKESRFRCHLKYPNGDEKITKVLSVSQMNEPVWGYYPAFFVVCPFMSLTLENSKILVPNYVGVSFKDQNLLGSNHFVNILYPKIKATNNTSIALCPGPAHSNFSNALRIAEFVEIYKVLGVNKFYFYNMSISPDVSRLFDYYRNEKTAEILNWDIDRVLSMNEGTIHYYGIMATLNDCFYRAAVVDGHKYVIIADYDEIILPMKHDTLKQFLESYDEEAINSLLIRNFFVFGKFDSDYSNVPKNAVNKFLYTQAKITRLMHSTGDYKWFNVRTKLIGKRDKVIEIGNHYVWNALKGTKEHYVDQKDALMLHYRDKCTKDDCNKETVRDVSARRFSSKLWTRIDAVCGKLFTDGVCPTAKD